MNGIKPGRKTSEFWLSLIAQLVPVLVIVGVLSPEEADTLNEALVQIAAAGLALATALGPILAYIKSRTEVKKIDLSTQASRQQASERYNIEPA